MVANLVKTELLSPAGTLKAMRYAFAYGADAVYAGQPRYSLRVRNNEFTHANLKVGIDEAHAQGKKFYVVVNIAPHNNKLKSFIKDLEPVIAMKPDALIMSDPGLIMMVRENFPDMDVHLSVQSNAVNWATVKFWKQMGLTRIILSRELSIKEIEEIRENVPDIELEVFVHGALCMAYSGRCLLSGYINHRDANQGTCTNACRWKYDVEKAGENELGEIVRQQNNPPMPTLGEGATTGDVFVMRDQKRPDDEITAFEDEHGTYIMNSKDLRAVQHVEKLASIGVDSLKIEGRTKSHYYCARTAQVYRKAIDDALSGRPFDGSLMTTLESLAHRGYTEGFLQRHKHKEYQNYETGNSIFGRQVFAGEFTGEYKNGLAEVIVKNRFELNDQVELMSPQGNVIYKLEKMENKKGVATDVAPGDGHIVYISVPEGVELNYALLVRYKPEE